MFNVRFVFKNNRYSAALAIKGTFELNSSDSVKFCVFEPRGGELKQI